MVPSEGRWLHAVRPEPDAPPDVSLLDEALNSFGESSGSIIETGNQLHIVANGLIAAQRQHIFAGTYGDLQVNIGHAIHSRSRTNQFDKIPEFLQPEVVENASANFVGHYFDDVRKMVDYYKAETAEERKVIYASMSPHWRWVLFEEVTDHTVPAGPNLLLENADPGTKVLAGGMVPHVYGHDLGYCMHEVGVPKEYLKKPSRDNPGGDFHRPINTMITYTSVRLGQKFMEESGNNPRLVGASMQGVALVINGLRRYKSIPNYRKFENAPNDMKKIELANEMDLRSATLSKYFAKHSGLAFDTWNYATGGGGPVFARFRKEEARRSRSGGRDGNASDVA